MKGLIKEDHTGKVFFPENVARAIVIGNGCSRGSGIVAHVLTQVLAQLDGSGTAFEPSC